VVRNGYHEERTVPTDVDPVSAQIPLIRNRDGIRENFVLELIKPFRRRTPRMDKVLAYMQLVGVAEGRMADMVSLMFGEESLRTLSGPTLNRQKQKWSAEHEECSRGSLDDDQWVYMWLHGIYMPVLSSKDKICLRWRWRSLSGGEKHLLATEEAASESTECSEL